MGKERLKKSGSDDDWWRGAVIYQVYPRSYQDSNGDGIGDLNGIIKRLPYIASLGVDALWISPFFTSPMKDFGYDVSDYRDVDPMFGSLADFDELVAKAHALHLKVIIDLVLSHSSDQHEWFQESQQSRENPKADWYVWADPKLDGTPPNNWLSIFGGPAWQWSSRREQYYLHNFLISQPDLNFHNKEVQEALLEVARFWLERGTDGFRLDTINFYMHDDKLRSNPALSPEERSSSIAPSVNPYNYQRHLYSKNQPQNLNFLKRLRQLLNEFEGRTLLGEVGDAQLGLEILGQYTSGDEHVHMCYAFEFLEENVLTARRLKEVAERMDAVAKDGWACWAYSNHDVMRHRSRWDLSQKALRAYTALLMCFRGSICIYQGEELGFDQADVSFDDLQDPYGIEFWPEFKGRDGCRTPMVWDSNAPFGGFSDSKPWLPISPTHLGKAPNEIENLDDSILLAYRNAISLRRREKALAKGSQSKLEVQGNMVIFSRKFEAEHMYCAFNLGDEESEINLPSGNWKAVSCALCELAAPLEGVVKLGGWCFLIAKEENG